MAKAKSSKNGKWLQKASKSMVQKGTKGRFTVQAKRAGMTVPQYTTHVLKPGSKATAVTKKRARFSKTVSKIAKTRRAKKG